MFLIFGVLALSLAVVGLYGVKSYVVAQRTREIGIRMALGVKPLDPLVFTLAPLALALAAFCATWLPTRRATRVNPLTALRGE